MGPLLVLVSPCFTENAIVTCKIVSLLHKRNTILHVTRFFQKKKRDTILHVDTFLPKNVFFSFFGNKTSNIIIIIQRRL